MLVNADLHIHSRYSAATSQRMELKTLAVEAARKGIQLLGTGDCLHPKWLSEIKELREENGIFRFDEGLGGVAEKYGTAFVLTVEVEDARRVHHLLLVPTVSKAEELFEFFSKHSKDIEEDGRPTLNLNGEEIAEVARDCEALIGPCHAFTPWTALYAYHDSLKECYGSLTDYVSFVELGLSADSSYADRISELHELTFLTNSDAHSPSPIRLAREFNRFELRDLSFEELKMAILREKGRKPVLNVGIPPEEGKYNESACIKCYKHYTLEDAVSRGWRCSCGGRIKKGVKDRVKELADCDGTHPPHRPPYLHLIPLAEIIALALRAGVSSKAVRRVWEAFLERFGDEVRVLVDADYEELSELDEDVAAAILAFREGKIVVIPGGGGRYGVIRLAEDIRCESTENSKHSRQLSLLDF
ncbi:MAG: PHP family phosphoesterase with a Zn ribbon [Candidatus Alkanophagales archaeon MCA70_species_1]|nr:PHP family phosphoesterase with a Zn ribbon [Candidatus Alkanophaga volatiphilum]